MPSGDRDQVRDYGFADQALALRKRTALTQDTVAKRLGVSVRSVQAWESGASYPSTERLKQLIALYLEHSAFTTGREVDEAAALWRSVRGTGARRAGPFDVHWFESLRGVPASGPAAPPQPVTVTAPPAPDASLPVPETASPAPRHDWGDAPDVPLLQGRAQELATLTRWVCDSHCRVVAVLGAGGIGKTALAARLAQGLAPEFPVVYWRSLRNAPPVEEWLAGAISTLSAGQALPPMGLEAKLGLLVDLLRVEPGLLVLDNFETVLEPSTHMIRYRAGYEGYGEALRRLGESAHRGCLLLTSREKPLREDGAVVRVLYLEGLGVEDGRALLSSRDLAGDEAAWQALVRRYAGNPLALQVVGETVREVFDRHIAVFLAQEVVVFGGIRDLLDQQVVRLSALEQAVLNWLAVERELVGFGNLVADLGPGVARAHVLEAVEALRRRSLLETLGESSVAIVAASSLHDTAAQPAASVRGRIREPGGRGAFTLQPVVLEYVTARLVAQVSREVLAGEPALLVRHALVKAQSTDYVRRSQEQLIAQPLLEQLRTGVGDAAAIERRLLTLLETWQGRGWTEQGYGPGNVVNLLRLLRGNLRGLDLSRLSIRQAYMQEVEAQDGNLAGSYLAETVLAAAFTGPRSISLSADGAYLVVGTTTGEVWLWRVADRTPLLVVQTHGTGIHVALSADGRRLVSGYHDGRLQLWEGSSGRLGESVCSPLPPFSSSRLWAGEGANQGRLLATLEGHTGAIWGVALSGDGKLVASASTDGTIRLWDVSRADGSPGRLQATLEGHSGAVYRVVLSRDGRLLISGGQDGMVKLWDIPGGRLLATLEGHTGVIWGLALSADGRLLVSCSQDGTVKLWELPDGRLLTTLRGHTGGVWRVALSADGRLLASAGEDGTVRLWDVPTRSLLTVVQERSSAVFDTVLSNDGDLAASAGYDGAVRLWEAPSGRPLATLQGHIHGGFWCVALSVDGQLVAGGGQDGIVRLWEVSTGRLLTTLHGHSSGVRRLALSSDGRIVASAGMDGTARLWEVPTGRPLATLQGHTGLVYGVALSGDGRLVASGGQDGTVRLWEACSGRLLATLEGHRGTVQGVALSSDGHVVASASEDGAIRLWEAPTGRLGESICSLWANQGSLLATLREHRSAVYGVALSRDGRLLASGGHDGTARLWKIPRASDTQRIPVGHLLATLKGHTSGVHGVALSADGRLLVSASYDGTVKLWDAAPGSGSAGPRATLQGHSGLVRDVAVSDDGTLVASASEDGTVRLWDTQRAPGSDAWLRILRSDRPYERLDITGLTGVTAAQRAALLALGAVEGSG